MNCVIEGNCVKVFGKAIHALSRIGDELWLDPMVKGLALRSVNSAHSAYGCFLFSPLFFQQYSLGSFSGQSREAIKCKMIMKSLLPLFRCRTSIEHSVERCHISVNTPTARVIIQFFCRHGITKTHNLGFQESEALQAVFDSHLCSNVLKAPARLLGDMVMHFPVFQEEITLSMTPLIVCLRNYQEEGKGVTGHMKTMHTEMSLHSDEFDFFRRGEDSDVTFCLKELRGILSFAESHCLPVSVHFGAAGKPVCFSVEDMVLEATVVLATLTDSVSRSPSQPTETLIPTTYSTEALFLAPLPVSDTPFQQGPLLSRLSDDPHAHECADAAALPVGGCVGHGDIQCDKPDGKDQIRSSQGSPITNSIDLMHLLPQIRSPTRLCEDIKDGGGTTTSPASTMVCSLLFKALSSEQEDEDDDACAARMPVLVCFSDEEENDEDNNPNSCSL